MVAYIQYRHTDNNDQWYVNEHKSFASNVNDVEQIQADGDELEAIVNHVKGIPNPPHLMRIVTWFGDDAKFIFECLNWINTK